MRDAPDTTDPTVPGGRYRYLDSLRICLMFLGVPFHAAFVYDGIPWYTGDVHNPLIAFFTGFTHTFRMPAFFVIAGIMAGRSIRRTTPRSWTSKRIRRLGIPLVTCLLVLGPPQLYLIARTQPEPPGLLERWTSMLSVPSEWIFQLWFLIDLLIYSGVLAAIVSVCGSIRIERLVDQAAERCTATVLRIGVSLGICGALVTSAWLLTVLTGIQSVFFGFVSLRLLILYLPTFVLGVAMSYRADLLDRFGNCAVGFAFAAVIGAAALTILAPMDNPYAEVLEHFLIPIIGITMSSVVVTGSRRFLDFSNRVTRYLADASMSVYLLHNVFLLAAASLLLHVELPAGLNYLLIIACAVSASLLCHAVISRSTLLSWLFTGRPPRTRTRRVSAHGTP